jgi:membrane associated rhomboid family serine protease
MNTPVFTYTVIAITTLVSLLGFYNKQVFEKGLLSAGGILKEKQYYRLITSQLLHAGPAHLFFNMFSYYSFGESIERVFGLKLAAVIYLYSALGGDALALVIRRKNPAYSAVGASGAVCGVIFASIFLLPGGSITVFPVPVPMPSWVYACLFMGISLYGLGKGNTMIGHEAHIGGALTGMLWAVLYRPSIIETQSILLAGLTIPTLLLLAYVVKTRRDVS